MKKLNKTTIAIIIACVIIVEALVLILVLRLPPKKGLTEEEVTSVGTSATKLNDYIIIDNSCFPDSEENAEEQIEKSVSENAQYIKKAGFEKAFFPLWEIVGEEKPQYAKVVYDKFKEEGIALNFDADITADPKILSSAIKGCDVKAVLLSGATEMPVDRAQKHIKNISDAIKKVNKDIQIWLEIDAQAETASAFYENEKADMLVIEVPGVDDETSVASFFEKLRIDNGEKGKKFIFLFSFRSCEDGSAMPNAVLRQVCTADRYDFNAGRIFGSLSSTQKNEGNCFSAVRDYLSGKADSSALLCELSIDGYNGKSVSTDKYKQTVTVNASPAFPLYLDGKEIDVDVSGKTKVKLSYKTGENSFTFSQCAKELVYNVNVEFSDPLVRSVKPDDKLSVYPGQKNKITVSAVSGADVSVRIGSAKFSAKETKKEDSGYSSYSAQVEFPNSEAEINSIGKIIVTVNYMDKSSSFDAAQVVYRQKNKNDTTDSTTQSTTSGTTLNAQNNVTSVGDVSSFSGDDKPEATKPVVTQKLEPASEYTGSQMCMITGKDADTWPGSNSEDKFVPYCSVLANGTIDYISGQTQAYDNEKNKTRYYYYLSCGRRVEQDSVQLLAKTDLGDNSVTAVSSSASGGELKIVFSQKWKVPVTFNFSPQDYYSANGRLFNVNAFTANTLTFTFHHTDSFGGSINTSGSDIVSGATWSKDSSAKTVTLTMPLKTAGRYYGYSGSYDDGGNYTLIIHTKPRSLYGSVVLLDPGHGGNDSGAMGYNNSIRECEVNLATALLVKSELERRGATVYMTRTSDTTLSLEQRKAVTRSLKPDVFVSIHSDASPDSSAVTGTSAFYFKPMSKALSSAIHEELVSAYKNDIYADLPGYSSNADRGCRYHPFSVTRVEDCPSVLIELGFMTNEFECSKLSDQSVRAKLAVAVANGIEKFMKS